MQNRLIKILRIITLNSKEGLGTLFGTDYQIPSKQNIEYMQFYTTAAYSVLHKCISYTTSNHKQNRIQKKICNSNLGVASLNPVICQVYTQNLSEMTSIYIGNSP